jgi:hypothetical protein
MRLRLRSSKQLKLGLAALAVVALLLPGLRASAQTKESTDEFGEDAKPAKQAKSAEAEAPAEATESTPPPPPLATEPATDANPYVPFAPPPAPLRIENSSASIQFGILAQPQLEVAGAPDATLTTKNLFLRRIRFMVGGTLFKTIEIFFQTDWPNLFKLDPADTMAGTGKNTPGLNVQDAYATWKLLAPLGERVTRWIDIKLDAGFMLPASSHNSLESAAKLYGADYFANSFRRNITNNFDPFASNGPGGSPVGRDAGVQLRTLALNGHIDLRIGMFQGYRVGPVPAADPNPAVAAGVNMFRVAGRLQINLLDAEPGYFYQGTYLGAKKILSLGVFYDRQNDYKYFGGDLFVDLPVGPGIVTAQGNAVQWEGGTFLVGLTKHRAFMGQLGYLIGPARLSPFAHFERLTSYAVDPSTGQSPTGGEPSEDRYGGGLSWWPYGFNSNLKVFFAKVHRSPAPHDFNVIMAQWQVYFF